MKTKSSLSILIFSVTLISIIAIYIFNNNHTTKIQHLGFSIAILLLSYFLFITISNKYVSFRKNISLQSVAFSDEGKKKSNIFLLVIIFLIPILILIIQLIGISVTNSIYVNIVLLIFFIVLLLFRILKFTKPHD